MLTSNAMPDFSSTNITRSSAMSPSSGNAGARVASTMAERLNAMLRVAAATTVSAALDSVVRRPGAAIVSVPVVDAPMVDAAATTYLLLSPAKVTVSPATSATAPPDAVVSVMAVAPLEAEPVTALVIVPGTETVTPADSLMSKPATDINVPCSRNRTDPASFALVKLVSERIFAPAVVSITICRYESGAPLSASNLRTLAGSERSDANGVVPAVPLARDAPTANAPTNSSISLVSVRNACVT